MPLSVRGRSASSVFRSPKLLFPLVVSQDGLSAKTEVKKRFKSMKHKHESNLQRLDSPGTGPWTAELG
jgi:hypothetical protein